MDNETVTLAPLYTTETAATLGDLLQYTQFTRHLTHKFETVMTFMEISELTGGCVHFAPELNFMPVLNGNDNVPVFLYHLVEGFQEFLRYDDLLAAYPTLSYSQISSALSFLRKVSQLNAQNIDIDELEDEIEFSDENFVRALQDAFEQKGDVARVLSNRD